MKGYKVFNEDWTCRDFKYEVGKTYLMPAVDLKFCESGFHFCTELKDCFQYYVMDLNNKVAEVEASGIVIRDFGCGDSKCCTNKIKIIREMPWEEVMSILNSAPKNFGIGNTGSMNFGDYNAGLKNFGFKNVGINNCGNRNSGDGNNGIYNSGCWNSGQKNTGNRNLGSHNVGNNNVGNHNVGDWNATDYSTGCFNTKAQPFYMFNKPAEGFTIYEWLRSREKSILDTMPARSGVDFLEVDPMQRTNEFIWGDWEIMSERDYIFLRQKWWNELSKSDKVVILSMPNFDAEIFKECTGIDVCEGGEKYATN